MDDRQAFERAINDAPDDDAPKLVYADWLDDRGEYEEAAKWRTAPLAEKIKRILSDGERVERATLSVESHHKAVASLRYGQMYDAPAISFDQLQALSELFGTTAIDVDDYAESGCESCDWGSDYGHTIQIHNPTRYANELRALVGTELLVKRR